MPHARRSCCTSPGWSATLGQLLDEANTARRQGADDVVVDVDRTDGHPTSIRIDPRRDAIDDESCYDISDYSAG